MTDNDKGLEIYGVDTGSVTIDSIPNTPEYKIISSIGIDDGSIGDIPNMSTVDSINNKSIGDIDNKDTSNNSIGIMSIDNNAKGINSTDRVTGNSINGDKVLENIESEKEVTGSAIGYKNLIPFNQLTEEAQRELARKGAARSAEVKRARRTGREIAQAILAANMTPEQIEDVLSGAKALLGDDTTAYAVMTAKMVQCANMGDVKAAIYMRDTAGDKPEDNMTIDANLTTPGDTEILRKLAERLGIKE